MRLSCHRVLALLMLPLLLAGCSVYAPMLPAAPQLRDKGQVEVQATSFLTGRWEAGLTYSPRRHVLLRAAGGLKGDRQDTSYFRIQQYELGIGGYQALGSRWLLSGLGGFGQARSARGYLQPGLFIQAPELVDFRSRYRRVFGELTAVYTPAVGWGSLGMSYRLAQVRFDELTYNGAPLGLRGMARQEPMVFVRFGAAQGDWRWVQLQAALGVTSVPGYRYVVGREPYEYMRIKETRSFGALTLIFRPHLFRHLSTAAN